jgi:hypothetical protein
MLSHAVMSVIQVFSSFVILSLASVFVSNGLPSVEMWFDHGEDWCCDLSKVGMVETIGFCQVMWHVMLKSAKDQILGVDISGQHVPPHVRYGTALGCNHLGKGFITRINLSDSQRSENTINTHKYNTIFWSSSRSYYNLGSYISDTTGGLKPKLYFRR